MTCKVVMIGGGSYAWTPKLAEDLFHQEQLDGSELVLVDIDPHAADTLRRYCVMMAAKMNRSWTVAVADPDDALPGADVVCVSISTGGLDAMHLDLSLIHI